MLVERFPAARIDQILHETWGDPRYTQARLNHLDGHPALHDYIILAGRRLWRESEGTVGLNWSRGVIGDLASDGLSILMTNGRWYFKDVIVASGSRDARVGYSTPREDEDLRDGAGNYIGIFGVVNPEALPTHFDYSGAPRPITADLGVSLFWAPDGYRHHRQRLAENLRYVREVIGASFIRVIWKKGSRADQTGPWMPFLVNELSDLPPSFIAEVHDFVASHGLKLSNCIFGDFEDMPAADQDRLVDHFIEAVRGPREASVAYWNIFNEPYIYGGGHGGDAASLRRLGRRLRAGFPSAKISLGTPPVHAGVHGDELRAALDMMYGGDGGGANLICVHFDRGSNLPPAMGPYDAWERTSEEPRGPYSSNAQTSDPAEIVGDLQVTSDAGYRAYVFHPQAGIWSDLINPMYRNATRGVWPNLWDMPRMGEIAAALRARYEGREAPAPPAPPPTPPPPPGAPSPHALLPGQELRAGQRVTSPSGRFYLEYQHDGNLVIYEAGVRPVWAAQLQSTPGRAAMQTDGNFVVYDGDGVPRRASGTSGSVGAAVQLQDDGNLVMYRNGVPIWASFSSPLYGENGRPIGEEAPSPPPPPPPPRAELWLGPNIGSDVQRMATEPDLWRETRGAISAFQAQPAWLTIHAEHPHREISRVGPNWAEAVSASGLWRHLRAAGVPIAFDVVGVGAFDPTGATSIRAFLDLRERLIAEDIWPPKYVSISEPLTQGKIVGQLESTTLTITAAHIRGLRDFGIPSVGLVEAYPNISALWIVEALKVLETRGAKPDYFHLDFDWYAFPRELGRDLRLMRDFCRERGITFGISATIGRAGSEAQYAAGVRKVVQVVIGHLEGEPDRWICQSWWPRGDFPDDDPRGVKDLPYNLPESDPVSLTGLARWLR